jgi:hypothetical protein
MVLLDVGPLSICMPVVLIEYKMVHFEAHMPNVDSERMVTTRNQN